MAVSEIIRFSLPRTAANTNAFMRMRAHLGANSRCKAQYFGYVLRNEGFPQPKSENQMCWYIEWPEALEYAKSEEFRRELAQLAQDKPHSLLFDFQETKPGGVQAGLRSPVCQFAVINLVSNAPRFNPDLESSMHKTFTDCYRATGFVNGGWGYALNSNDADGDDFSSGITTLDEKERRLGYYVLGWESLADHHAYAKTPIFDEEIDKLQPYFAPGTGAFYVKFETQE